MSDLRTPSELLIGTSQGLFGFAGGEPRPDPSFGTTRGVSALAVGDAGVWAVAERHAIVRRDPEGAWTEVVRKRSPSSTVILALVSLT